MISWLNSKWENFEQFVTDVIYDRREPTFAIHCFSTFLRSLSTLFRGIVQFRYLLYRKGIFRSRPLGCLVVVVGNLTVGGTGKTPVVEKFARSLQEQGRRVAIL
ncbi:MAG: tetraacyldisaccharide 4'-kinase, partial [Verrucomicrobia bacterium CG_4_10_14_3_um_filter_43_23]